MNRIAFVAPLILLLGFSASPAYAATACHKGSGGSECEAGYECSIPTNATIGVCVLSGSTGKQCHKGANDCAPGLECNIPTNQTVGTCVVSGTGGSNGFSGGGSSNGTSGGGSSNGFSGGGSSNGTSGSGGATLQNPLKFNSLPDLMNAILQAIVDIGAIVLIFMLVWVGFQFVTAQGNPEKISSARSALLWTIIGGLILLGAEAISKVIEATVSSLSA